MFVVMGEVAKDKQPQHAGSQRCMRRQAGLQGAWAEENIHSLNEQQVCLPAVATPLTVSMVFCQCEEYAQILMEEVPTVVKILTKQQEPPSHLRSDVIEASQS